MRKIISIIIAIVVMSISCLAYANSSSEKLIIGYTEFEPYNYTQNGKLTGFDTELAEYVCSKLGLKPEFVEINWDAKEIELNSGNVDCIWNALTSTEERRQAMSLTDIYLTCMANFEDEQSIEGYSVAFKKGSPLVDKVNIALTGAKAKVPAFKAGKSLKDIVK